MRLDHDMLDLNDVRLFVQVVDHGGFARAARALRRPKSSVSHRIAQLEAYLETRLIQRTSRRFSITDVGREFYDSACAMLTEATSAEEVVRRRTAEPRGVVRLTASTATAHAGLASILADFVRDFPKVRVHLTATNRAVDLVEEGFDLAVRAHEGPLPDSGMIQRRLGSSPRWLVAAPHYLAGHPSIETPADVDAHNALCLSTGFDSEWILTRADGAGAQVRPSPSYCADDVVSLRMAACRGVGIAALPAGLCKPDVEAKRLVRVLPDWIAGSALITLLAPSRRGQLPSVRAVSDYVATRLRSEMGLIDAS